MSDRRYRRRREPRKEEDNFDRVADVARSAYRIASKIKDVINIETKSYLYAMTSAAPDPLYQTASFAYNGLTPVTVNTPPLGDEDYERIADSIKVHRLKLMLRITKPNNIQEIAYRVVVFWDEGNQVANVSNIFYATLLSTPLATVSPKDWDQRHDSRILYDKHFLMKDSQWNGSNYGSDIHYVDVSLPIGLHTQFEAGTQAIVTGALKFTVISDSSTNSTLHWQSMITYTDD